MSESVATFIGLGKLILMGVMWLVGFCKGWWGLRRRYCACSSNVESTLELRWCGRSFDTRLKVPERDTGLTRTTIMQRKGEGFLVGEFREKRYFEAQKECLKQQPLKV